MGGGLVTIFDLGGGEYIHDTVVMNEKGCFSLGRGRVCWRDGPSSKDFLALKCINISKRKKYALALVTVSNKYSITKQEYRRKEDGWVRVAAAGEGGGD